MSDVKETKGYPTETEIAAVQEKEGVSRLDAIKKIRRVGLKKAVEANKAPKAPKVKGTAKISKGDAKHYDQQRVIDMFLSGKTIAECAAAQKPMSVVYAHRILTTKVPEKYAAEQAKRATAREKAKDDK